MKAIIIKLVAVSVLLALLGAVILAGCANPAASVPTPAPTPPTTTGGTTPPPPAGATPTPPSGEPTPPPSTAPWQWPDRLHVAAIGTSGVPKLASFLSIMEQDTGMTIRIIPEASPARQGQLIRDGEMFLGLVDKTGLGSMMEAREDFATRDGGPYPISVLWISDLANSGLFVRGDSDIKTIYDIGPGTRIAVWDMKDSTLRWPRAYLHWLELPEKDIFWFDAGTTAGAVRAITDGRADVMFFFPISAMIFEAAAAPHGIRFLELNSEADPEGAKRLNEYIPGTTFGPIAVGPEGAVGVWGTVTHKLTITRQASDPDLVYHYVKWLDENYDAYKDTYATNKFMTLELLLQALDITYVPAHEGLVRYLKEKGVWTEEMDLHNQGNHDTINALITAYAAAIKLADEADIEVTPVNEEWIEFWEQYKIDNNVPKIAPPRMKTVYAAALELPPDKIEGDVEFEFVSITNPAYREDEIVVVLTTEPGAEATIRMWFSDQREAFIPFRDRDKKTAEADGKVVFNGELGHIIEGVARVEITVTKDGQTTVATTYTEIRRP